MITRVSSVNFYFHPNNTIIAEGKYTSSTFNEPKYLHHADHLPYIKDIPENDQEKMEILNTREPLYVGKIHNELMNRNTTIIMQSYQFKGTYI